MADIFISYAREDRARIEKLSRALEAEGFSVWWDRNLSAGAHFTKETEAKLKEARVVIVAWSKASIESMWVADEASIGRDRRNLMPIAIDTVEPPIGFRQVQTMAFEKWNGDAATPVFAELAQAIRSRFSGETPPRAAPIKASWTDKLLKPLPLAAIAACLLGVIVVVGLTARPFVTPPPAGSQGDAGSALQSPAEEVSAQRAETVSKDAVSEKSVAVLPFIALSSGEDDGYFADGLTEEIINALTTLPDLLVTARTSAFHFKGKDTPIPDIAKTLGVAHVVEGSVRRAGDKVRITAQLIRAGDGFHLWSETYDRSLDDVFGAQTDIAENIARTLGVLLDEQKRARMADVGVRDIEAFLAYQRGMSLLRDAHDDAPQIPTLKRANAEFEIAITRKPDFAQAHFQHADLYAHVLMDELVGENAGKLSVAGFAQDEAVRRLAADLEAAARFETDPGQRLVIRAVRTFLSNDWRGLGAEMDRAFEGWENCRHGLWMDPMGIPLGRADAVYRRSLDRIRCDPIEEAYWTGGANSALMLGRPEETLRIAAEAERIGSDGRNTNDSRLHALFAKGRHDEAAEFLSKKPIVGPELLVAAPAAAGNKDETQAALARFVAPEGDYHLEIIAHAVAGDRGGANRIAAMLDAEPLGAAVLTRAAYFCFCGAPFDLTATPNFARQLKEGDLPWPPKSPIDWPLKDW